MKSFRWSDTVFDGWQKLVENVLVKDSTVVLKMFLHSEKEGHDA